MQNTVEGQQLCEDVVGTLTEFSMYYRELLDKVVSIGKEDGDWVIPLAGSAPSEELLKMTRAWREAEERLDFAALWSIDWNNDTMTIRNGPQTLSKIYCALFYFVFCFNKYCQTNLNFSKIYCWQDNDIMRSWYGNCNLGLDLEVLLKLSKKPCI